MLADNFEPSPLIFPIMYSAVRTPELICACIFRARGSNCEYPFSCGGCNGVILSLPLVLASLSSSCPRSTAPRPLLC